MRDIGVDLRNRIGQELGSEPFLDYAFDERIGFECLDLGRSQEQGDVGEPIHPIDHSWHGILETRGQRRDEARLLALYRLTVTAFRRRATRSVHNADAIVSGQRHPH
jgi:hypothetical protein